MYIHGQLDDSRFLRARVISTHRRKEDCSTNVNIYFTSEDYLVVYSNYSTVGLFQSFSRFSYVSLVRPKIKSCGFLRIYDKFQIAKIR